MVWLIDLLVG